jgi:F0F1-type ATP synthase assembly protein I
MNVMEWSTSNADYGRKLVDSAVEGAREGEKDFLREESLARYFAKSAQKALVPATVIGALIGMFGEYVASRHRSPIRTLACGFLGGAIGFGAGMIWETRQFTADVASSSWKSISKTRDERWLEKNPIDYA